MRKGPIFVIVAALFVIFAVAAIQPGVRGAVIDAMSPALDLVNWLAVKFVDIIQRGDL